MREPGLLTILESMMRFVTEKMIGGSRRSIRGLLEIVNQSRPVPLGAPTQNLHLACALFSFFALLVSSSARKHRMGKWNICRYLTSYTKVSLVVYAR